MNSEVESLRARLKGVIIGTCNTVGCKACHLKFDAEKVGGECSASELERKIEQIEFKEV